jgi:Rod binding domain-containing protein
MTGVALAMHTPTHAQPAGGGLRRAAQAFEAQALSALLAPMFEGLRVDGPLGGGHAEAQWRPMLVEAVARDLARAGGLGLAESVLREMTRMQATQSGGDPS